VKRKKVYFVLGITSWAGEGEPLTHLDPLLPTEMIIKSLLKKKQDKVEEIKKKTGYYSTRDLLEKYDEALRKKVSSPSECSTTTIS
jgi:hypothetical protein